MCMIEGLRFTQLSQFSCLSGRKMVPTRPRPLLKDILGARMKIIWEEQLVDSPIAFINDQWIKKCTQRLVLTHNNSKVFQWKIASKIFSKQAELYPWWISSQISLEQIDWLKLDRLFHVLCESTNHNFNSQLVIVKLTPVFVYTKLS